MDIEKLIGSDIRREIMLRLLEGPERLTQLRPKSAKQAVNNAIQPLLEEGLIEGQGGLYSLTDFGRVHALILQNVVDSVEVLQSDFWRVHDLSSIPDHLLARIGDLAGGQVVCPNGDLLKAQHNFVDVVSQAKEIYGASSVFFHEWPGMIIVAIEAGAAVRLIFTPDVFEKVKKSALGAYLEHHRFDYSVREFQAAFTIADNTLSLGLFAIGGGYDPLQDFICESPKAAAWGRALYEYYRDQ